METQITLEQRSMSNSRAELPRPGDLERARASQRSARVSDLLDVFTFTNPERHVESDRRERVWRTSKLILDSDDAIADVIGCPEHRARALSERTINIIARAADNMNKGGKNTDQSDRQLPGSPVSGPGSPSRSTRKRSGSKTKLK